MMDSDIRKMESEPAEIETILLDDVEEENETSEEIHKWEDTCRVCTNGSDHMIPIYENEGAEHKLGEKIHRYLPIEVSESDILPLKLCFHCASTLLAWHELITGCLEAEEKLLKMLTDIQQKEQLQLKYRRISSYDGIMKGFMMENGSIDVHHPITAAEMKSPSSTIQWEHIKVLNSNKRVQETVAQNELVDDPETTATEILEMSSEADKETETSLMCEQEESYTIHQMEETSENVQQRVLVYETTERSRTSSRKQAAVSPGNGINLAHAEVSSCPPSGTPGNKVKTKMLEETTNSPETSRQFSCEKCSRRFLRESNLKNHKKKCQPERKTEKSTTSSEGNHLNEPEISNDDENAENDCIVEETKSDGADFREECEIQKEIEPRYACLHCDFTVQTKKLLNQHTLDHHPDVFDPKEEKNQRIINRILVRRAKMEADGRVYYHCNDCGKNLFSTATFIRHMRIHTGERPFICHLCGKQFRINQGLLCHLREYHAGIKKFPCDICGRKFSTKQYVEDHRRIHTGECPFVCEICGKTFRQRASLTLHNRTHSDVFPFNCSYCGQKFRTKTPLEIHLKKHTGEKPYTCDICDRPFRMQYDMKCHRLVHFDEKPWKCSDCGLSFRQKRYLTNHKRINAICSSTKEKSAKAANNE